MVTWGRFRHAEGSASDVPALLEALDVAGLRRRLVPRLRAGQPPFTVSVHVASDLVRRVRRGTPRSAEVVELLADLVGGPWSIALDPRHWDGGRGSTARWGARVPHGLTGRGRTAAGQIHRVVGTLVPHLLSGERPADLAEASARLFALYPKRRGVRGWLKQASRAESSSVAATAVFSLGFHGDGDAVLSGLRQPSPVREVATLCAVRLGLRPVGRAMALQRRRIPGYDHLGITTCVDDDVGSVVSHVSTNVRVMGRLRAPESMARALLPKVFDTSSGPIEGRLSHRQRTFLRAVAELNLYRALSSQLRALGLPTTPEALFACVQARSIHAPRHEETQTSIDPEQMREAALQAERERRRQRFERLLVEAAVLRGGGHVQRAEDAGWALVEQDVLDPRAWAALGLALLERSAADAAEPLQNARRLDADFWVAAAGLAVVSTSVSGTAPADAEALHWPSELPAAWADLGRWRASLQRAGWQVRMRADRRAENRSRRA